jgi:DNA topoisomerase IB
MISVVKRYIETIHADVRDNNAGVVAGHLPDPFPIDADAFGICIATQDGHLYEVGDARTPFSMYSVSKPFTYALALTDRGLDEVNAKIDVEPSGEAYDEASIDRATGRPFNAMINAGAIMASSLVDGDTAAEKFEHIREFGRRLPAVRRQIEADLATRGLNRRRVLAAAARLLDIGFFRVGGKEYAEDNGSYGLATVLCEHVHVRRGGTVVFDYPAKWGQERVQSIADPAVVAVIRALLKRRRPGQTLLAYYQNRTWRDVSSTEVNEYLRELFGIDVSSKDFRTWHGTVLAAVALAVTESDSMSAVARRRAHAQAMRDVSRYLGNTPAISRSSYVDPTVVDAFEEGTTISSTLEELGAAGLGELATRGRVEQAVLELLEDARGGPSSRRSDDWWGR